jgi:hypothetical protein
MCFRKFNFFLQLLSSDLPSLSHLDLCFFSVEGFRSHLVDQEQELVLLREENSRLKSVSEADRRRIKDLEDRLVNAEAANSSLQRRVEASKKAKVDLENEVKWCFLLVSLRYQFPSSQMVEK